MHLQCKGIWHRMCCECTPCIVKCRVEKDRLNENTVNKKAVFRHVARTKIGSSANAPNEQSLCVTICKSVACELKHNYCSLNSLKIIANNYLV